MNEKTRKNAPFTVEQESWIIFQYAKLNSLTSIRREFRTHFNVSPFKIPRLPAFLRVIKRFQATGTVKQRSPPGRPSNLREHVADVEAVVEDVKNTSISSISSQLNISKTTVWRILRKELKFYPYTPKTVQPLTDRHKIDRSAFCNWILEKGEEFLQKVLWSDEKMWYLKTQPNKQNEKYWSKNDPHVEIECKQ